jgi:Ion channel
MSASARRGAAPLMAARSQSAETGGAQSETEGAQYRYAAVFVLILGAVLWVIVAPDGDGARAVTLAIVGTALLVAVGTSRERTVVRRRRLAYGGAAIAVLTIGTAASLLPHSIALAAGAVLTLSVPATLAGGLLRLVRERGATLQAVAGALAIYLSVGLAFSSAIGFVAAVGSANYFAETANSTPSEHVYYSFTVLTTTGFGDLTAAHSVGRALAVLEMLTGQLYLVTVIGILIGRRVEKSR